MPSPIDTKKIQKMIDQVDDKDYRMIMMTLMDTISILKDRNEQLTIKNESLETASDFILNERFNLLDLIANLKRKNDYLLREKQSESTEILRGPC